MRSFPPLVMVARLARRVNNPRRAFSFFPDAKHGRPLGRDRPGPDRLRLRLRKVVTPLKRKRKGIDKPLVSLALFSLGVSVLIEPVCILVDQNGTA
jgi:hypothetical protein